MTELINGDGTIPAATSAYAQHAIASSTNASPIEVTFSAPHGFHEGDTIEIEGHLVNTSANGLWRVHLTSTTKVQLIGSGGVGVGGATGYALDYSVTPLIQVGDDGDAASASNFNTATEGCLNFVPWLYQRSGAYRVKSWYGSSVASLPVAAFGSLTSVPNTNTWTLLTGTDFAYPYVITAADPVTVAVNTHILTSGAGAGYLALGIGISLNGSTWFVLGGAVYMGLGHTAYTPISMHTAFTGLLGTMPIPHFGIVGYVDSAAAAMNFTAYSPHDISVVHYRAN